MPVSMESTRYSSVKGEKIAHFLLTTWLRNLIRLKETFIFFLGSNKETFIYIATSVANFSQLPDVGLLNQRQKSATSLKLFVGL